MKFRLIYKLVYWYTNRDSSCEVRVDLEALKYIGEKKLNDQ